MRLLQLHSFLFIKNVGSSDNKLMISNTSFWYWTKTKSARFSRVREMLRSRGTWWWGKVVMVQEVIVMDEFVSTVGEKKKNSVFCIFLYLMKFLCYAFLYKPHLLQFWVVCCKEDGIRLIITLNFYMLWLLITLNFYIFWFL